MKESLLKSYKAYDVTIQCLLQIHVLYHEHNWQRYTNRNINAKFLASFSYLLFSNSLWQLAYTVLTSYTLFSDTSSLESDFSGSSEASESEEEREGSSCNQHGRSYPCDFGLSGDNLDWIQRPSIYSRDKDTDTVQPLGLWQSCSWLELKWQRPHKRCHGFGELHIHTITRWTCPTERWVCDPCSSYFD